MLKGRTAVITGGSRGIGAAIAKKFASLGADIAIIDYGNPDVAEETRKSLEDMGVKAQAYLCDVTDGEKCKEVVKNILDEFGVIDILVNNAGITRDNLLVMMEESDFDAVINTNLKGCFNMIKACGRTFIKKKYGKIINISSISGIIGLPGQANYSASKAGVIGLTKAVAKELAGKNICCNAIAPGFIMTDMTKDLDTDAYLASIPMKKLGAPEDVAKAAAFLASDMSDYITGEVLRVDGGIAM